MSNTTIAVLAVLALFAFVLSGVHIAFALLVTSFLAMVLIANVDIASSLLAQSAYHTIYDYVFVVVPLFILMGAFMTQSRAATELYTFLHLIFKRLRGGLGVSTVFANAVFAAVTGASVASAAVFSKIALPQMLRYGYAKRLALGCVGGSSVLGMLIPPSLLMIIYGILTQVSIGSLFIAGVIPGLLLALIYSVAIVAVGYARPALVGIGVEGPRDADVASPRGADPASRGPATPDQPAGGRAGQAEATRVAGSVTEVVDRTAAVEADEDTGLVRAMLGSLPVVGLVALVIGGIWGGLFSPTEASGVGALGAFVIGRFMGMDRRGVVTAFRDTAVTTGAIMVLLIAAQMYSRMLASSGVVGQVGSFLDGLAVAPTVIVLIFVAILIVMGAVLDSTSIILLAAPVMFPTIQLLGLDPLWFGIVMIVAVEVGLLTPPFGMIPFTMSAVIGRSVTVEDIFAGSFPFFLLMLVLLGLLIAFPGLVTWLPAQM